jgi:hypothetical protein
LPGCPASSIKARLPDYFCGPNGVTRDVVLLMLAMLKRDVEF